MKKQRASFKRKVFTVNAQARIAGRAVGVTHLASIVPNAHLDPRSKVFQQRKAEAVIHQFRSAAFDLFNGPIGPKQFEYLLDAGNMAHSLCTLGLGADDEPAISAGQTALAAARDRCQADRFSCSEPEWRDIELMLGLHEAQLRSSDCTDSLITAAIRQVRENVRTQVAELRHQLRSTPM